MSILGRFFKKRHLIRSVAYTALLLILLVFLLTNTDEEVNNIEVDVQNPSPVVPAVHPEINTTLCPPLTSEEIESVLSGDLSPYTSPSGPHKGQEPPHYVYTDGPRRYHNPYNPLQRTSSPCDNTLYTKGNWVYNESLKPMYPARGKVLGSCERGFRKRYGTQGVRKEVQYQWEPDNCELIPWNEELFCRSLRGRSIMMVGDSLTDHWHASLYYLLGGEGDIYIREGTGRGHHRCQGHAICRRYYPERKENPVKIFFLTNQFLEIERQRNRNFVWWRDIHQYPILILNSGAWMVRPENERTPVSDSQYYNYMRKTASLVRRIYKGTVIWRTTFRGHPFCWDYTEPLKTPLPIDSYDVGIYKRYRWNSINNRNAYTTELWKQMGAHILDVAPIIDLMPLGHMGKDHPKYESMNATDCLHYCSPGAAYDLWSMLLMNLLAGNIVY